jgi:hypothetical protein
MRSFTKTACRYAVVLSLFTPVAQGRVVPPPPDSPTDEYGNLCWDLEQAHLDNLAIELQNRTDWTGLILFYDGNPPCHEAALARAMRRRSTSWSAAASPGTASCGATSGIKSN